MGKKEKKMIKKALKLHRSISPCSCRTRLKDCFTRHNDRLIFWFNTEDRSTRVLVG